MKGRRKPRLPRLQVGDRVRFVDHHVSGGVDLHGVEGVVTNIAPGGINWSTDGGFAWNSSRAQLEWILGSSKGMEYSVSWVVRRRARKPATRVKAMNGKRRLRAKGKRVGR